jgi:hypothetical protein
MRSKIHRWVGVFVVVASMGTAGCGGCNEGPTRAPSAETPKKGKAPRKGKAPAKRPKGKAKADVERVEVSVFLVDPTGGAASTPAEGAAPAEGEAPATEQPVEGTPPSGEPELFEVKRKIGAKMPEKNAVWVLFKGASPKETEKGVTFVSNGVEGFQGFAIEDGVAKLQLRGSCENAGAVTVFDSIAATLKQFESVEFVQVAGPGETLPEGLGKADYRPDCLQP